MAIHGGGGSVDPMKKVNLRDIADDPWVSPGGKFGSVSQNISEALGRKPHSTDLLERHPFDIELCRVPAGKSNYPYHSHSAQWEYYQVISGQGTVRHAGGTTAIETGDTFIFAPGEPHQITNGAGSELVMLVVADNPLGDTCHYPDSNKWLVRSPERRLVRSEPLDYFDGEE